MPGGSRHKEPSLLEHVTWGAAAMLAARTYQVRPCQVLDCRGRRTRASGALLIARRAALYLAAVGGNLSVRALCRATSLDHSTIERHLAAVEDDREAKAELDARLDEMTAQLQSVLPHVGYVEQHARVA